MIVFQAVFLSFHTQLVEVFQMTVFVAVDPDSNEVDILPYFVWPQISAVRCFFPMVIELSFEGGPSSCHIWSARRSFPMAMVIMFSFELLPYLICSHHGVDGRHQSSPSLMETFFLASFHPSDEEGIREALKKKNAFLVLFYYGWAWGGLSADILKT